MAGRCSAAQADSVARSEALLRIREARRYLRCASSWKQFCPQHLNISASQADRIIRMWQLHGPGIFELRQLIRISPEAYNAVEPFIQENAHRFKNEAIELDPQNSRKIADAVAELRRTMPPKDMPAPTITAEFEQIARQKCRGEERLRLELTLNCASAALQQIESSYGLYPTEESQ